MQTAKRSKTPKIYSKPPEIEKEFWPKNIEETQANYLINSKE